MRGTTKDPRLIDISKRSGMTIERCVRLYWLNHIKLAAEQDAKHGLARELSEAKRTIAVQALQQLGLIEEPNS